MMLIENDLKNSKTIESFSTVVSDFKVSSLNDYWKDWMYVLATYWAKKHGLVDYERSCKLSISSEPLRWIDE
jgi:hypothetical protein